MLDQLQPGARPQALVLPGSPCPRESIIVFPGSFNPPTIAHLALLKQARRYAQLHQPMGLYAAFSKHTVDKEAVERPLLLDRITLLEKLLRRRIPKAGIMLFNRGLYLEQAEAIRQSFPKVRQVLFLMGFDKLVQIFDPRYYTDRDAALSQLFELAELLVAPRGNQDRDDIMAILQRPENRRFAPAVHPLPFEPAYRSISSTEVRQGAEGSSHEVPQEVRQFMRQTRAYAEPLRRDDGTEIDCYEERKKRLCTILGRPVS